MERLFAVAGNPILKSRSPEMMNAAFGALSMDAVYTRLAASDAADIVGTARSMGMKGLNITAPFKETIVPFLDELDPAARTIGSVNTVVNEAGILKGYNTDFTGVMDALILNGVDPRGKKALVLGAAGAGRAAVFGLLSSRAAVTLVNRTFAKARDVADAMGCAAVPIASIDEAVRGADILVSCIPACDGLVSPSSLGEGLVLLDAHYTSESVLARDARLRGARVIDGREWLLFQALPSFRLFTDRGAPVGVMRAALYRESRSRKTNVGLVGFMGAGKSTIAPELARRMNMAFLDTDRAITERTGLVVPEIFRRYGEEGFRMLEGAEVRRVGNISHTVVSFGGGAVLKNGNRDIIGNCCISLWLWASPNRVAERTASEGARPLLAGNARSVDVEEMLKARLPLYALASDCVINTDGRSPEQIVERICYEIGSSL